MSERVAKFGRFLKPGAGVSREYPWTPYAEVYRKIVHERLGVGVAVEKFQIRVRSDRFYSMYTRDTRVEVVFPITSKKRWIIRTKPHTSLKRVESLVRILTESMRNKDLKVFEGGLNSLFNFLDNRFSLMIYEYNVKPWKGSERIQRKTGKRRIRPPKGRI